MDALKKAQKDGEISEDELKAAEKEVQKETDNANKGIATALEQKEADLLSA